MAHKFNTEIFEEWQSLAESWDRTERELRELEGTQDGAGRDSRRENELREELSRLKTEIDSLVLRTSKNRDKNAGEMVVALIDTKPENISLAEIVRERLSGRTR